MNWARGLFRIWIVAAVVWVAFVGFQTATHWPSGPTEPMMLTGRIFQFEKYSYPEFGRGALTREQQVAYGRDSAHYVLTALSFATIPPAVVLAIAWLLAWIGRGFKRDPI
jgi:hypothetical protein